MGTAASFLNPGSLALDGSGNVYVADSGNRKIRKIAPGGFVTTLAGSGSSGTTDGPGTAASFSFPASVAVDASGNVYVADATGRKVRKVTAGGAVTTLAGSGSQGSADGLGTAASFVFPVGVAVDGAGNVLVADAGGYKIRKVTPAGLVTTLAGSGTAGSVDGTGSAASFLEPYAVAVDAAGNAYVADSFNNKVRKVTPAGVVTTVAGSGASGSVDGAATAATFNIPRGVAVDGATLYVADWGGQKIRKVAAGIVTTLAGSGRSGFADGPGTAAAFYFPSGVAVDAGGNVYVADSWNHDVRKVSAGGAVTTLAGSGSNGSADGTGSVASFFEPAGVAADGFGNVYVADTLNQRIRKVAPGGVVTTLAGSGTRGFADGTGTTAKFTYPYGVAADGSGNVFVADSGNHAIRKVTFGGVVSTLAGTGVSGSADGPGTAASFNTPYGVAVDALGSVYVADWGNSKIRKVTPGGTVSTLAGTGSMGSVDGPGTSATFWGPSAVALDAQGNVYAADAGNYKIRKVTAAAMVSTLAGSGRSGSADGTGSAASFDTPGGVAVDASGTVWVADTENHLIRKISPGGAVSTVGGTGSAGHVDGAGTAASFYVPNGVAVDASGNVYVADTGNSSLRVGRIPGAAACTADAGTLCLLGSRFRVTAEYGDYGGGRGPGHAVPLTSDTGTFWFFSPANVEAVVKFVSFCGSGSNNVAVYAGGLTDLDVTLRVTDTRDGNSRSYRNPLGTPFTLVRDGPFTCPAVATEGGD